MRPRSVIRRLTVSLAGRGTQSNSVGGRRSGSTQSGPFLVWHSHVVVVLRTAEARSFYPQSGHGRFPSNRGAIVLRVAGGADLFRATGKESSFVQPGDGLVPRSRGTIVFRNQLHDRRVFRGVRHSGALRRSGNCSSYIPPQYSISSFMHMKIWSAVVDCVHFPSTAEILCSPISIYQRNEKDI